MNRAESVRRINAPHLDFLNYEVLFFGKHVLITESVGAAGAAFIHIFLDENAIFEAHPYSYSHIFLNIDKSFIFASP